MNMSLDSFDPVIRQSSPGLLLNLTHEADPDMMRYLLGKENRLIEYIAKNLNSDNDMIVLGAINVCSNLLWASHGPFVEIFDLGILQIVANFLSRSSLNLYFVPHLAKFICHASQSPIKTDGLAILIINSSKILMTFREYKACVDCVKAFANLAEEKGVNPSYEHNLVDFLYVSGIYFPLMCFFKHEGELVEASCRALMNFSKSDRTLVKNQMIQAEFFDQGTSLCNL